MRAPSVEQDFDALLADAQQQAGRVPGSRRSAPRPTSRTTASGWRPRLQAAAARGKAELAAAMIGVIDNLERALQAAGLEPAEEQAPRGPAGRGLLPHLPRALRALQRAGIESFDPAGEHFDPACHEALQKLRGRGRRAGLVVEVMQKGYRLGEQLIRPARVVVSE